MDGGMNLRGGEVASTPTMPEESRSACDKLRSDWFQMAVSPSFLLPLRLRDPAKS